MNENQDYEVYTIPENYSGFTAIPFIGFVIKSAFIKEAIVMCLPAVLYVLLTPFFPTVIRKIVGCIVLALPFFIFGCVGIGGDSVFKFVSNAFRWANRKGMLLYNPRIKEEAKKYTYEELSGQGGVSSTTADILTKFGKKPKDTEIQAVVDTLYTENVIYAEDMGSLYFEDDKGVIDAPEYYGDPSTKAKRKTQKTTKKVARKATKSTKQSKLNSNKRTKK